MVPEQHDGRIETMPMSKRTLDVLRPEGFRRMAYTEWAGRGGAAVICVHGLTRQGRDFDALAEALDQRHGRRVLCPDVLGRGRSDWLADPAGYSYPMYLADMAALLARADVTAVDWVGTSMGGLIGLMLAATPRNPVRRLVINDIGPLVPADGLARIGEYVGDNPVEADRTAVEARLTERTASFGPLPAGRRRAVLDHSVMADPAGQGWRQAYDPAIANAFAALEPGKPIDLWAVWEAVTVPVLVVRGAESDLLPAEVLDRMKRTGPGCQVHEVPGVGHAPWLMTDDQMAPILDFLKGHG